MPSWNIKRADDHAPPDFQEESNLREFIRPSRWLSINLGSVRFLRINWVTSLLAIAVLWGFTIAALVEPDDTQTQAKEWQKWVSQNWTWLYIGTQNVWIIFLVWLCFSRFGNLKLGRSDEKPEFNDLSWFAMLFSCGIGVGIYYWGVSEPLYYYRDLYSNVYKLPVDNDDDKAQEAIFVTLFHWGLHGWCVYIVVALALAVVCYRWNMPLTMRSAFYPLLGDAIYSTLGDVIDALSIACTTFGVCTSLGFGVESINAGLNRLNSDIEVSEDNKVILIWVITVFATASICVGLHRGIQNLANITFAVGLFLMFALLFMDNTWYLLNSYVQALGHYVQWLPQVSFQTDAYQQLEVEFADNTKTNMLWGSNNLELNRKMTEARALVTLDESNEKLTSSLVTQAEMYGSHHKSWIDWWTIFYWGWWISWAPFVGMFIAKISRGRTIRQVIIGSFLAPCAFSFLWLCIFGNLGIKMQRIAELTLATKETDVNWQKGFVDCAALGYDSGGIPNKPASIKLAEEGYYALSCRSHSSRIFDILEPYSQITPFLVLCVVIGVMLYFVTSSDSGSFIDDILAAQGMPNPPVIQKILWAFTEGALATALIRQGGDTALSALQAVSICAGLPYTFACCFLTTSLYRALKIDQHDDDIVNAASWSTGIFDCLDLFAPSGPNKPAPLQKYPMMGRVTHLVIGIFAPFMHAYAAAGALFGTGLPAITHAAFSAASFLCWFALMFAHLEGAVYGYLGWTCFIFFVMHITMLRFCMREKHNIYGSIAEDFFGAMMMYPWIMSQVAYQAAEDVPLRKHTDLSNVVA